MRYGFEWLIWWCKGAPQMAHTSRLDIHGNFNTGRKFPCYSNRGEQSPPRGSHELFLLIISWVLTISGKFVCLSVFLPACMSMCLSTRLPVCLPIFLSVCLSTCLSVCLSTWQSACLSDYLSVCPGTWLVCDALSEASYQLVQLAINGPCLV